MKNYLRLKNVLEIQRIKFLEAKDKTRFFVLTKSDFNFFYQNPINKAKNL
jgi:hypothetical protein